MELDDAAILRQIEQATAPRVRESVPMNFGRQETLPLSLSRAVEVAMAHSLGVDLGTMGAFTEEGTELIISRRKKDLRRWENTVRKHAIKAPAPVEIQRHYACGCVETIDAYDHYQTEHSMLSPCEGCAALYHKRGRVLRALRGNNVELVLEGMGFDNPTGSNIPLAHAWLEANPL